LGYWLAQPYWGRGIISAAAVQICAQAFEELDIIRIFAEPFAYNAASRKVLEKAGFVLEGVMKQAAVKNGQVIDYCMYALLKE
jgi:ribosomal-protein-alanine N-acetyltransferase